MVGIDLFVCSIAYMSRTSLQVFDFLQLCFCTDIESKSSLTAMLEALCIHARLGAAVGISEGKHDRKNQSDIGLIDWCHHKVRCACYVFHFSCVCNYCCCINIFCKDAQKQSSLLAVFLGVDACQKSCSSMFPCSCCLRKHDATW